MKSLKHKVILQCSLGLLAAQLAFSPLHAVHAEEAAQNAGTVIGIASTALKNGTPGLFSSNVSSSTPGYLSRLANDTVSITGVDGGRQFFYNVPRADVSEGSYIDLDISYSELLVPTSSTLTVSVDGKPVKSILLTKENSSRQMIRIPLSGEDVTPGFHSVALTKHSTVSNDACTDEENAANWLKINRSSAVFIHTSTTWTTSDTLGSYPFPFVEAGIQDEMYGAVLLPDNPSSELISSAMEVAGYLSGQTATDRSTPILTESEWLRQDRLLPVVALGATADWTGPVAQLAKQSTALPQKGEVSLNTFTVQDQQKGDIRQVLLLSAADDKSIKEHIALLTDQQYVDQLAGNELLVKELSKVATTVKSSKGLTLESLGFSDVTLNTVQRQSDRFTYSIPSHWSLTGEAELKLKVRVSALLQSDASQEKEKDTQNAGKAAPMVHNGLTVVINDVPKTFSLSELVKADKTDDSYLVTIPLAPYLKEGAANTLNVDFSANINEAYSACASNPNSGRWIFIDNESSLLLPHEIRKETSFKYWPAPFVGDQGLENTVFLLPKSVNGAMLSQLAALTHAMTEQSDTPAAIDIVRDGDPDAVQRMKGSNLIVIGSPNAMEALGAHKDSMLVNADQPQFHLANYNIINETTDYAAWIQASPWDKDKTLAVFQASEGSGKAKTSFVDPAMLQFLKGENKSSQIVVMSQSKEVLSVDIQQEQGSVQEKTPAGTAPVKTSMIWVIAAVGVLFLIGSIILIRLVRRPK
ncbi:MULTISPECIES: cellulose biosynthesis cyclic di-GMP-binding regulatory protein BcsB [Paenibacillus]|uniref:cellulose biosynthesis cyclic di-GMP-binding regulatory protein BcsB n=1 Tax=Paenibacillus TaxID=44249 RepID=UPI0022B8808E|nr:cellulose biosynthesis cyclic di-GMP-binding regulatory protein BcsB [Paenibacillus caseinilyticus]MCZ8523526.1 cellulose biosynthesis cyclic di-GMP-binding regulatory protein BcsB [Paenibacillus caseinilyticus]